MTKTIKTKSPDPMAGPDPSQLAAVRAFAFAHGPTWREELLQAWLTGEDTRAPDGHLLRQVRNRYGPAWLSSFTQEPVAV